MHQQAQVAIDLQVADVLYPKSRHYKSASLRQLSLAILIRALRDIFGKTKSSWDDDIDWKADAREWFYSEADDAGSFKWVCEILNYNRDVIIEWINSTDRNGLTGEAEIYARVKRLQIPRLRSF